MLDQRRVTAQPDEQRELMFTERYENLLVWAMVLTNQQREAAEDLVQDAFVQFMLGRTRLEEIENIDGYLRKMLRYMHVSRLSRSAQHLHEAALSVADYDSGRLGWTAIEPPRRMQASEELHQICTYACSRKESSRAGSVLILRFFHEYFPTEIAAVLNTSRHCIDQWQRLARQEAKLFTNEPRRLRFVNAKPSTVRQIKYLKSGCDLMLELRQMIFNSCQGECLSQSELAEIYTDNQPDLLTTPKVAHIVSCQECLDAVNGLLGLPSLAHRYRTVPDEPKKPPGEASGGGASGGGGSGDLTRKFAHRLRETHEHKPHELCIAVNGNLVSSVKVSSDLSELNLNLTPNDPVEFVEVTSEQGVQLLFFSIDPTVPRPEQWAWIELSEGRLLEACLENENGPTLHVVYKDPVPAEAYITGEITNKNASSSPLFVVQAAPVPGGDSKLRRWLARLFRKTVRRVFIAENPATSNDEKLAGALERVPFHNLLSQSDDRRRSWQRLALPIVLVSAVVIGGFLFFKARVSHTLTAAVLLERASVADNNNQPIANVVNHRTITLEERRSAEGAVVARYKIEIYTNSTKGDRAQRLYDESDRLIAAAWQKADGSRTVYHHGAKPQAQPALTSPETLLLSLENVWQLEPSPETFAKLIAETGTADVEERDTTYLVSFDKGRAIGASRLVKATLTLSRSNLYAIEQTLLVQRGDELREYRFGEASLGSSNTADPAVFAVEPELIGGAGETGSSGDWAIRDLTTSRVPPTPSTSTPPTASAELEVDVAYLLNQAKADRNEQVALTRSAGGSLRVEGIVDTKERKEEFLRALAPVSNNPAVRIDIQTVAEKTQRRVASTQIAVQQTEETDDLIAADNELRTYFERRNSAVQVDEQIRNYSARVTRAAYGAVFHAVELRRLLDRFASVDMRTVTPDARTKFLVMVHQHAAAFERDNATLLKEIQPVFFPGSSLNVSEDIAIENDADLARAVDRLHKLAISNNEAISAALTISARSSAVAVKSAAFWQSLQRAELLAKNIRQYQVTSN
ncbi:MAG TPA: sigma-70 family RNA polymerase sigma factor [Pyrinomonadaceae bacterium]|nr:sigma-70 family RNA polymerase sigma factor [Pyrinomonadaceae bacterium]